jgi:hypothetical protein
MYFTVNCKKDSVYTYDNGRCITTGNGYRNNEFCSMYVSGDCVVCQNKFHLELDYDVITIGGEKYSGDINFNGAILYSGTTGTFETDSSVARSGFDICCGSCPSSVNVVIIVICSIIGILCFLGICFFCWWRSRQIGNNPGSVHMEPYDLQERNEFDGSGEVKGVSNNLPNYYENEGTITSNRVASGTETVDYHYQREGVSPKEIEMPAYNSVISPGNVQIKPHMDNYVSPQEDATYVTGSMSSDPPPWAPPPYDPNDMLV